MGDVGVAFKIAILTYALGCLACGLVGVILFIVRKVTLSKEEGVE